MPKDAQYWDCLHNAFNPSVVLAGQQSDELFCEREHSPFEDIKIDFRIWCAVSSSTNSIFYGSSRKRKKLNVVAPYGIF